MGYVSASRSIGSVDADRVHSVLAQSLRVSEARDDKEAGALFGKTMQPVEEPSSSARNNTFVHFHRSLHHEVTYRGASSMKDLPSTPPSLVKTFSLESVSSASSSSSSVQTDSPSSPSRSIFGRYWEVKKEKRIDFRPRSSSVSSLEVKKEKRKVLRTRSTSLSSLDEVQETSAVGPPSIPDISADEDVGEGVPSLPRRDVLDSNGSSSPQGKRRSIFAASPSSQELVSQLSQLAEPPLRKASSTSVLITKRRSCLQTVLRYSSSVGGGALPSSEDTRSAVCTGVRRVRSSSVSFSPQVDVIEFQKACEVHAEEGWSNWFH